MDFEGRLAEELKSRAAGLPQASGDLRRVKREGRRRLVIGRTATIAAMLLVALGLVSGVSTILDWTDPQVGVAEVDGPPPYDEPYALTPDQSSDLINACMDRFYSDVQQETESSGPQLEDSGAGRLEQAQEEEAARREWEAREEARARCSQRLEETGYLLPSTNPDYLRALYARLLKLATCYQGAGISVSEPPGIDNFVDSYQTRAQAWSPMSEADELLTPEGRQEAEEACGLQEPSLRGLVD